MDVQEEPLPLLTLTVGNTEIRQIQQPNQNSNNSDSESQDSSRNNNDLSRFNAYLNRGSELWTHWTWLGGQGKMSLMRCNYCLVNKQLKNAPKCRRHLIKCQKTPEVVRKYFERKELEASRVSAFMREIRSKEVKFPRNQDSKNSSENDQNAKLPKLAPKPTANDLKHLHQKQQASITNVGTVITGTNGTSNLNNGTSSMGNGTSSKSSSSTSSSSSSSNYSASDLINKTNILMNYSPLINRSIKTEQSSSTSNNNNKTNQQQNSNGDPTMNDINYNLFYHLMSMTPMSSSVSDSIDSSHHHSHQSSTINNHSSPVLSNKLKRKLNDQHLQPCINGINGKENNNIHDTTNKKINNVQANNNNANNTVVINLDDMSMDDPIYFNSLENGESLIMNGGTNAAVSSGGGARKKKRDSNGYANSGNNKSSSYRNGGNNDIHISRNGYNHQHHHHHQNEFTNLDSHDIDIVHDDLNDLLMSALISEGIELNFVKNPYFQKFITQLVKFSATNNNYRLPTVDKLSSNNIINLIRKFDYETAKVFSESDSIIVSFENNNEATTMMTTQSSISINCCVPKRLNNSKSLVDVVGNSVKNEKRLNVNLLISSSNTCLNLFYKTISCSPKSSLSSQKNSSSNDEVDIKTLNNQIDSLFNKLGPDQINAVILPYKDKKSSDLIYSYLSACHSHIVPLTNSYRLFHHLLCDICRIPSIYKLITQCMTLFQELLVTNLFNFHEENQNHWKQVFESDNLKIFKYFLNNDATNSCRPKNTYWISLNLMLCWFLVARSSIIKLFNKELSNDENNNLNGIMEKSQLEVSQLEKFFDQISILFNFLTPFINAIHLIENESTVISDIIKIYYDVKLAINNNNFFNGINKVCDKTERHAIDSILNGYLQEHNFSRYFFLAYYLDPRFRDDRRIEENEELTAQVYDALFNYAQALGCVNNEEEDREKLVDSLEEFRNSDKLYGMQLLKCPKSPSKFWKHLRRFPSSAKLAYCASRLLSISTCSMLVTTPPEDPCIRSLSEKILNRSDNELDNVDCNIAMEKLLPIKSYLLSSCQKFTIFTDEDENMKHMDKNGSDVHSNGGNITNNSNISAPWNVGSNISNIISNVISSLDKYTLFIAQPFSTSDLSTFINQPSN